MNIGEMIRNRRLELGLTLEKIGEAVGVGKSTVRKWESGQIKDMKRDKIAALSKVLKMSPIVFIFDDEKEFNDFSQQIISHRTCPELSSATYDIALQIDQLDAEDKAEIRGEVKHMLKADKYLTQKELKNA